MIKVFEKLKQLGELKKMRDQAVRLQKELAKEQVELEEGGIKVLVSGDQKIQSLQINGEENHRVVEVINKALKKSQKVAARKLQQMGGGLMGLLKGMGQ